MEDFQGYKVGLFVNNSSLSPPPFSYSFSISDNIYLNFPLLTLNFPDGSGIFLEYGNFTQGIPLNIKYGISNIVDMLDVNFYSTGRDAIEPITGTPGLSGNLQINGTHESFLINRDALKIAFKEITISDIVKKIFPSEELLKVEETKGKVEAYDIDDNYTFVKEFLLPQATNGKVRPYVFFRNLLNELHFESIEFLENNAPSEKLFFGNIEDENGNAYNVLNSFLPFNESINKTMINFHVEGKILKDDLTIEKMTKSIASDSNNKIPVLSNTRIHHEEYFNRQFNPKVEYSQLNNAYCANIIKSAIFLDKAFGTIAFHPNLVAGKVVDISVTILDEEGKPELSETFSGKWLIEQSYHYWDGFNKKGMTKLIFCRSSMKPRQDSIIIDRSFSD